MRKLIAAVLAASLFATGACAAEQTEPVASPFDAALAASLGADEYGMRSYVLVILRTGPTPHAAGKERDDIFKGHFANMKRLAAAGKLVLAGPLDGVDGWRGLFILAAKDIDEARQITATDPVVSSGEMVAEYHKYYGSAALMTVNDTHAKVARKSF